MKAAITGASGFIGNRLMTHLHELNWEVIPLNRDDLNSDDSTLSNRLEGCDVIINLAGAPIIARHTTKHRKEIYDSRINTTNKLVNAIKLTSVKPAHFISGSAVGIYSGQGTHTETSNHFANDFMALVVNDWESAASKIEPPTLLTIVRQGIILDPKEGALPQMMLPFKLGVGGRIGSGNQMFSWIHIADHINAFMFVINQNIQRATENEITNSQKLIHNNPDSNNSAQGVNNSVKGVYNFVSPGYLSNADFTKILASALNRPSLFTVPEIALKLLYGGGSKALISGQAVYPERLLNEGFKFQFPVIETALKDLLK